jgi:hypothetical protein
LSSIQAEETLKNILSQSNLLQELSKAVAAKNYQAVAGFLKRAEESKLSGGEIEKANSWLTEVSNLKDRIARAVDSRDMVAMEAELQTAAQFQMEKADTEIIAAKDLLKELKEAKNSLVVAIQSVNPEALQSAIVAAMKLRFAGGELDKAKGLQEKIHSFESELREAVSGRKLAVLSASIVKAKQMYDISSSLSFFSLFSFLFFFLSYLLTYLLCYLLTCLLLHFGFFFR